MSDDERDFSEEEESEEEEEEEEKEGPSEAELAMQKRRQVSSADMDESAADLLEENRAERAKMEAEIREMRSRSERRKRERQEEEKMMAERRAEEEAKRKADEEERRRKKDEEESERREARAQKMADLDKFRSTSGRPNFVISKKDPEPGHPSGSAAAEEGDSGEEKKSKEQLEEEKRAILQQRIKPLQGVDDMSTQQLAEKAKELHDTIFRLECDRYSLEKRFRNQQVDMIDLAEKARKLNVVGKTVGLKRLTDDSDIMQEKFAGCPSKIEMYSRFERQKDKREYSDRQKLYVGPIYGYPAERIEPCRKVEFQEGGMPQYADIPGAAKPEEVEAAE